MNYLHILTLMLPIILITFAGYVFSFFKKSDPKILADLIIYVTAPSLFILSLSTTKFAGQEILIIILTAIAVIFSAVGILWILRKRINIPLGLYLPTAFMNSSFIGFPIILMAYGMQGLARAVIYDVTNGLLIYSLGIYIASGKTGKWEVFKTPILYSAAIGILLNFFNIKLPESIGTTLAILGSATIPLALFMLGIRLGNIKITSLKLPIASSLIRAGFGMAIAAAIVKVFNIPHLLGNILIIMSALPAAITPIVIAEEYRPEDSGIVASAIAVSTLLSVIYLPLLIILLK